MGIAILWLAAFPFIMLYGAYEGPKVFWLWIGGFFLALWWIIQMARSRFPKIDAGEKWLILWILVLLVASIAGIHPIDSLVGGSYRHQGVLFFFTLFLIFLALRTLSMKQKHVLQTILACGVVLESIIVLLQKVSAWSVRPLGTLGEPNAIAGFLAVGLFWIATSDFQKRIRVLLYILTLLGIAATGSRAGIVTACIVTLGVGWYGIKNHRNFSRSKSLIIAGVLGVAMLGLGVVSAISISRPRSIFESRPLFWQLGVQEVVARPILGYGAESGEAIYNRAFNRMNINLLDFMVDRSHNLFLDVALWSGMAGLILFTGWCFVSGKELWIRDRLRCIAFIAWFVFASFQPLGVVHWLQLIFLLS
ncbi:MAG: O-antigen ligase family protein [Candidatus Gottesmanbacteria bacterium]|nr:O-antigen ligase family protein [Candidatus Gottesmanbacteria bacterium]